jgi:hypothetical protein
MNKPCRIWQLRVVYEEVGRVTQGGLRTLKLEEVPQVQLKERPECELK